MDLTKANELHGADAFRYPVYAIGANFNDVLKIILYWKTARLALEEAAAFNDDPAVGSEIHAMVRHSADTEWKFLSDLAVPLEAM